MLSNCSQPSLTPHRRRSSMAERDPRTGKDSYSLDRAVSIILAASSLPCTSPPKYTLSCKDEQSPTSSPPTTSTESQQFTRCLKPGKDPSGAEDLSLPVLRLRNAACMV